MHRDRYSGEIVCPGVEFFRKLRAPRAHPLGQACATGSDARLRHLQSRSNRGVERRQRVDGAGLDGEIAREGAHRVTHEEWLLTDMRDMASRGRVVQARDPGRVGVDGDDQVGVSQQRTRLEAKMHRVA